MQTLLPKLLGSRPLSRVQGHANSACSPNLMNLSQGIPMKQIFQNSKSLFFFPSSSSSSSAFFTSVGGKQTKPAFHSPLRHISLMSQSQGKIPHQILPQSMAPSRWNNLWKMPLRILPPIGIMTIGALGFDHYFADNIGARTVRAFHTAFKIWYWYKFEYDTSNPIEVNEQIHQKAADAILHVCQKNGGLYIKMGQGIITMSHVLPPQFIQTLIQLQDRAPTVSYHKVRRVFQQEFGKQPEELFAEFNPEPLASASIAQVHKARLKDEDGGYYVAVKVQKPEIQPQFPWDMWSYRVLLGLLEWRFELPMVWTYPYTKSNLERETDFVQEAKNSERAMREIKESSHLFGDSVYIPKVVWKTTSKRILTTEWIDGVKLNDTKGLADIGVWGPEEFLILMTKFFANQIFRTGFVHADPHFGNMFIRKHRSGYQLVVLDHGLYIEESERFRKNYCKLWKAIFTLDHELIIEVCRAWGIVEPELFASMTMMRPYRKNQAPSGSLIPNADIKKFQEQMNESIRNLLKNSAQIPLELVFVGRNINIVRSNNKMLGAPINRVGIMAEFAHQTLLEEEAKAIRNLGFWKRIQAQARTWLFSTQIFFLNFFYRALKVMNSVSQWTGRKYLSDPVEAQIEQFEKNASQNLNLGKL